MSPFSERLILLREQHRLPQRTVAEAIQITTRVYQRYEYGEREPQLSTVIALAKFYHISLDELVFGSTAKGSFFYKNTQNGRPLCFGKDSVLCVNRATSKCGGCMNEYRL